MENDRKEKKLELDRAIKAYYSGEMSCNNFIENYWKDNFDDLIQYVQQSGFNLRNGKIPQSLLDKKEEFIGGLIDYYSNNTISMEIGEQYYEEIAQDDIEICLDYWKQIGCTKSIKEIIRQYISGEIPEIKRTPVSKGIPKKDRPKKPNWYIACKASDNQRKNLEKLYKGKISMGKFVEVFSGTWEDVLDGLVSRGGFKSKEKIPEVFKARKEEFENAVIKYFGKDYCEMTQIPVNGMYVHPTELDVEEIIKYLQKNNFELGRSIIGQALPKYLKGEIQLDKEGVEKQPVYESQVEGRPEDEQPVKYVQVEESQADAPQVDEIQTDELQTDKIQIDELQADNPQSRTIDLGAMIEQRGKCEQLAMELQQMQEALDVKKNRLRDIQKTLSQPNIDISKIQEFASEMLTLAQQIEESQNAVAGLDIERLAGEQQLRKMKDAAIAEIEEI